MTNELLHKKAVNVAANFRKSENELLEVLIEIDRKKVFRDYGYSSLFFFFFKALKLSEGTTCGLIAVARKSSEVPELKVAM